MAYHSWKTPEEQRSRTPTHVGESTEYKRHALDGVAGIFGERLIWKCRHCKRERQFTGGYEEACPEA